MHTSLSPYWELGQCVVVEAVSGMLVVPGATLRALFSPSSVLLSYYITECCGGRTQHVVCVHARA